MGATVCWGRWWSAAAACVVTRCPSPRWPGGILDAIVARRERLGLAGQKLTPSKLLAGSSRELHVEKRHRPTRRSTACPWCRRACRWGSTSAVKRTSLEFGEGTRVAYIPRGYLQAVPRRRWKGRGARARTAQEAHGGQAVLLTRSFRMTFPSDSTFESDFEAAISAKNRCLRNYGPEGAVRGRVPASSAVVSSGRSTCGAARSALAAVRHGRRGAQTGHCGEGVRGATFELSCPCLSCLPPSERIAPVSSSCCPPLSLSTAATGSPRCRASLVSLGIVRVDVEAERRGSWCRRSRRCGAGFRWWWHARRGA